MGKKRRFTNILPRLGIATLRSFFSFTTKLSWNYVCDWWMIRLPEQEEKNFSATTEVVPRQNDKVCNTFQLHAEFRILRTKRREGDRCAVTTGTPANRNKLGVTRLFHTRFPLPSSFPLFRFLLPHMLLYYFRPFYLVRLFFLLLSLPPPLSFYLCLLLPFHSSQFCQPRVRTRLPNIWLLVIALR